MVHTINTTLTLTDKFSGEINSINNKIKKFGKHMTTTTETVTKKGQELIKTTRVVNSKLKNQQAAIRKTGKQFNSFGRVMSMGQEEWSKFNKEGGKFTNRGARMANTFRRATHGLRGFKMEMLSVMFFGMAMQRFFSGLLKPALQATGIFELWGAVLQTVFLPIALWLLDVLMPIFEWLMNLSDATKLLIGKWVLIGIAAGVFLFILGTLALGIGGIIMVFGGLVNIISNLLGNFTILGFNVSKFIGVILTFGATLWIWKKVKGLVGGLIDKFKEIPIVKEMIAALTGKVDENSPFSKAISNLKKQVTDLWDEFKVDLDEMGITGPGGLIESLKTIADYLKPKEGGGGVAGVTPDKGSWQYKLGNWVMKGFSKLFGGYESPKQSGGYIPHTGLYKLHAGESVNQAGSTMNNNIVVNASSNVDIEMLKTQLSTQWNEDLNRMAR